MREAYKRNWITARDGNISVRWHDRDHFWITPSAIRKPDLQPAMWKKMIVEEQDGKKTTRELSYTDLSDGLRPSGELPLHFGIQKTLPAQTETRVVVHLHPTYCIAAMHKKIDLHTLVEHFPELGRYTKVGPTVPDVAPISQELGDQCHKNLALDDQGNVQYDIIGIKGHGVVAIDETPWRAFEHIERLEHICKIVLAAQ
jgi:L-fuculose-phosphate aldolase